jgi:glyceraldehyde 3-phosphate dehydrogenase
MAIKIAINGFGRIGRLVLRAGLAHPDIEFIGINDLVPPDNLAYLFKYDSTHGTFPGGVESTSQGMILNGQFIPCSAERNPELLPWGELGADYVVECSGLFTDMDSASSHLRAGAKRVLMSAPTKDPDRVKTLVMGVNHNEFDPAKDFVVSNASCTTNCLAPVAKVIHENFGFAEGLMTTVHAVTSTQPTVDGPSKKDWRGGRGAAQNIIPAATGAAKAVCLVLPQLTGRLTGMALRIPTPDVSVVDLTFRTEQPTTYKEICRVMQEAANNGLHGILGYTEDAVVSTDFQGNAHSCIFDATAGMALNDRFFKIIVWYDNEWGYANRIIDLARHMGIADGTLSQDSNLRAPLTL